MAWKAGLDIEHMKREVQWTRERGAGQQWVELKKKFRPELITTRTTQQIEDVVKALKDKCDVELEAGPTWLP